jgi:hypothetical protein
MLVVWVVVRILLLYTYSVVVSAGYALSTYAVCMLYIRCMYAVCMLYIRCMYAVCMLYIVSMG